MSDNTEKIVVNKTLKQDKELRDKMATAFGDTFRMYELLEERYKLYEQALTVVESPHYLIMFSNMQSDVAIEKMLFKTRQDFEQQVSQIITRIDNIENDVKTIKSGLEALKNTKN
jgi:hypothetical protein